MRSPEHSGHFPRLICTQFFVPFTTRLASLQHRVIACRRTCSSLFAPAYCMALQAWSVEYVPAPNKPLLVCSNVCASRFAVIAALYCCLACGIQLVRPSCPTTCWSKYSGCLEVSPTLCHGWRVSVTCPCRFARPKLTEQPLARSQVEVSKRATLRSIPGCACPDASGVRVTGRT